MTARAGTTSAATSGEPTTGTATRATRTRIPRVVLTIEQATRLGAAIDDALSFLEKHRFKGEAATKAEDLTVSLGTERFQLARRIGQATEGGSAEE